MIIKAVKQKIEFSEKVLDSLPPELLVHVVSKAHDAHAKMKEIDVLREREEAHDKRVSREFGVPRELFHAQMNFYGILGRASAAAA